MTSPSKNEALDAVLAAIDSIIELHGFTLSNGQFLTDELLRRVENNLMIAELVAQGKLVRTEWYRDGAPIYVTPDNFVPGLHDAFLDTDGSVSFETEPRQRGQGGAR